MPTRNVLASPTAWRIKRLIDIAVSLAALIVLSPLLAVLAVGVALKMGRPVLFRQERVGLDERSFSLIKFRTLTNEMDASGALLPAGDRVTPFGQTMRRWSLDELPQFVNVLRGDLSLIGPRPLLDYYLPAYTERERLRHTVRPGITGLAQVRGRNSVGWDAKLALDVEYVERWSLALDAKIAVLTVLQLIRPSNVASDPGAEGDLALIRGLGEPPPERPAARRGHRD
ncbi:MAG TPA: sugar transferase [Thermomicrobiales bacterium]|jgi:lipopolysaccharide/colanic/teichoic acid biosynthesis glycosyltransferase|nr:sugar transferase [Thermomicrobiales bacterium]